MCVGRRSGGIFTDAVPLVLRVGEERMNKTELKEIMPHREPMLLLDEAVLREDGEAVGSCTIRGDEYFVQGHFPGNPVVPGVILCEMMAQTSSIILADISQGKTPFLAGFQKIRFRRPVTPGDTIQFHCRILRQKAGFYFSQGEGKVDGQMAVSGEFSFTLKEGV